MGVGESLSHDEAALMADTPAVVDSMRLNPKTRAGREIKGRITELSDFELEPEDVLKRLAGKVSPHAIRPGETFEPFVTHDVPSVDPTRKPPEDLID